MPIGLLGRISVNPIPIAIDEGLCQHGHTMGTRVTVVNPSAPIMVANVLHRQFFEPHFTFDLARDPPRPRAR